MLQFYTVFTKYIKQIHLDFSHDLSQSQMMILTEIANRDNCTIQKIAENLFIDSTTFSRQVASLEKKNFLKRRHNPNDRRYYILTLTSLGEKAVLDMNTLFESRFSELFKEMNEFEKETIIRSIKALTNKMNNDLPQ